MDNHDISVRQMLDMRDAERMGLIGRDPELQFVRLAAGYAELKSRLQILVAKAKEAQSILVTATQEAETMWVPDEVEI